MSETTTTDVEQGGQWAHADDGWKPEQIPTREEIERIESAASEEDPDQLMRRIREDDALDERVRTTGVEHMTPDNDPYGWIAGVETAHPDFVPEPKPQVPHALVWQHGMIEPQRFDHAVAKVLPNGTLLVTPRSSEVPLKGYAPGTWVTFEHIGDEYHTRLQPLQIRREVEVRPRKGGTVVQAANYAAQEKAAADEMTRVLTDPARRTPPTHEQDADETQNLPKVVVETKEEGGGVVRPFGRGVREDAVGAGRTPRPSGDVPERPGRLRSLWQSLKNPDWDDES